MIGRGIILQLIQTIVEHLYFTELWLLESLQPKRITVLVLQVLQVEIIAMVFLFFHIVLELMHPQLQHWLKALLMLLIMEQRLYN